MKKSMTLIEINIAFSILAFGLLSIMSLKMFSQKTAMKSFDVLKANYISQSILDNIKFKMAENPYYLDDNLNNLNGNLVDKGAGQINPFFKHIFDTNGDGFLTEKDLSITNISTLNNKDDGGPQIETLSGININDIQNLYKNLAVYSVDLSKKETEISGKIKLSEIEIKVKKHNKEVFQQKAYFPILTLNHDLNIKIETEITKEIELKKKKILDNIPISINKEHQGEKNFISDFVFILMAIKSEIDVLKPINEQVDKITEKLNSDLSLSLKDKKCLLGVLTLLFEDKLVLLFNTNTTIYNAFNNVKNEYEKYVIVDNSDLVNYLNNLFMTYMAELNRITDSNKIFEHTILNSKKCINLLLDNYSGIMTTGEKKFFIKKFLNLIKLKNLIQGDKEGFILKNELIKEMIIEFEGRNKDYCNYLVKEKDLINNFKSLSEVFGNLLKKLEYNKSIPFIKSDPAIKNIFVKICEINDAIYEKEHAK